MICDFLKDGDDFVHLFFAGEMAVIDHDGIVGLAERGLGTVGVAVVAIIDIRQHGIEIRFFAFGYQLIKPPLCPNFGRSGQE